MISSFINYVFGGLFILVSVWAATLLARLRQAQKRNIELRQEKFDAEFKNISDDIDTQPLADIVRESNAEYIARKNSSGK